MPFLELPVFLTMPTRSPADTMPSPSSFFFFLSGLESSFLALGVFLSSFFSSDFFSSGFFSSGFFGSAFLSSALLASTFLSAALGSSAFLSSAARSRQGKTNRRAMQRVVMRMAGESVWEKTRDNHLNKIKTLRESFGLQVLDL